MNNNFEQLKKEVCEVIQNKISDNEKAVINLINTILSKFGSSLTVRKNMSIASFKYLICNSSTPEEFKEYLNRLDSKKEYEIMDRNELNESMQFNEEYYKEDDIESYEQYKKFLNTRIKFNDNLYVIEYPKNEK